MPFFWGKCVITMFVVYLLKHYGRGDGFTPLAYTISEARVILGACDFSVSRMHRWVFSRPQTRHSHPSDGLVPAKNVSQIGSALGQFHLFPSSTREEPSSAREQAQMATTTFRGLMMALWAQQLPWP